jgi:hypothetical protein
VSEQGERRMTVGEIALMRQIIAWCKENGIRFRKMPVFGTRRWFDATQPLTVRRSVWVDLETESISMQAGRVDAPWHEAESVTQGVDVLVAYGYLPARFSSTYRAGYEVGMCHMAVGPGNVAPDVYAASAPAVRR